MGLPSVLEVASTRLLDFQSGQTLTRAMTPKQRLEEVVWVLLDPSILKLHVNACDDWSALGFGYRCSLHLDEDVSQIFFL